MNARSCIDCDKNTPALSEARARELLRETPLWTLLMTPPRIERTFEFRDYSQTMAFTNAVAEIAQHENHHPDLLVRYKTCSVQYSTHVAGGVTENDFICARKIDQLRGNVKA